MLRQTDEQTLSGRGLLKLMARGEKEAQSAMAEKHKAEWRVVVGRATGILVLLTGILLAAGLCTATPKPDNPIPSIFEPHSTPAQSIYHLSRFVLAITTAIFLVVFSLLTYAVVKFRNGAADAQCEPAQVYGSTQIELAWTIIPILIVVVLFLATARVIHAIQDAPKHATAVEVTAIGHQFWWEFRYPTLGIVTANELHVPVSDPNSSNTHISKVALLRHGSQLLGSSARGKDRPDSESRKRNVDGPAADGHLSRAMRPVLRHAAREDASPRIGR
jgi:hypothetical protein